MHVPQIEGDVVNGRRQGLGIEIDADENEYVGEYKCDGKKTVVFKQGGRMGSEFEGNSWRMARCSCRMKW